MVSPPAKPPVAGHRIGTEKHRSNCDQKAPKSSSYTPVPLLIQDLCLLGQASSSVLVLCFHGNTLWSFEVSHPFLSYSRLFFSHFSTLEYSALSFLNLFLFLQRQTLLVYKIPLEEHVLAEAFIPLPRELSAFYPTPVAF